MRAALGASRWDSGAPGIAGKRSCRVDRRHLRRADRRVEP